MKKKTYIVFKDTGNRVYVNPRQVPEGAIEVDPKALPKGVSPSFLTWDSEKKQVRILSKEERQEVGKRAKEPLLAVPVANPPSFLHYYVLLLLIVGGALLLWLQ